VRIGLLGGSFDPIHRGHVEAARAAIADLGLERVLFLPTARPPHKPERRFAPALRRYAMVELALVDEPRLEVSTRELDESRPVYTTETLAALRRERPGDEHVLLVGADSLAAFDGWRNWEEILATTEVGVFPRPGSEWGVVEPRLPQALRRALAAARLGWIGAFSHPASSSEIRRRIADGEALPEGWIDPRVLRFIQKYTLYR
jgi:nicotinate-nucleotide adenylyltransferase